MKLIETALPGVLIIEPKVFGDARGFFIETFQVERYREIGITQPFVQDNYSFSRRGILRGLHFQLRQPQGKLVFVARGEIFDVAVDIRRSSPTFGRWVGRVLSGENHHQMYVPEGFAHGFCVLSDEVEVMYKCTALYDAGDDRGIRWDDPALKIAWPVTQPQLSGKDGKLPYLHELGPDQLPA